MGWMGNTDTSWQRRLKAAEFELGIAATKLEAARRDGFSGYAEAHKRYTKAQEESQAARNEAYGPR